MGEEGVCIQYSVRNDGPTHCDIVENAQHCRNEPPIKCRVRAKRNGAVCVDSGQP